MDTSRPNETTVRIEALQECGSLPEENEIILMSGGVVLIDKRNPLSILGEQIGEEVLCG